MDGSSHSRGYPPPATEAGGRTPSGVCKTEKGLFGKIFPAVLELLLDAREGGVLHLLKREAVRFERPVSPEHIGELAAPVADAVKRRVVEHICRPDQFAVADLEPEADDPGRSVECGAVRVTDAHRHERPVVRAAHPPGHKNGRPEGVDDLADRRESALRPDDHNRVVLPHIAAGHQVQPLGARGCRNRAVLLPDVLDHVAARCSDVGEEAVGLFGRVEEDPALLHDVVDLEGEPLVHRRVDDEAGRAEGVGEDPVEEVVPRPGLGLIGHEDQDRIGTPLFKLHLSDTGPHPFDVAAERISEQVLAGTVEFHLFRDPGTFHEDVPRQFVDLFVVLALCVRHDQLEVITTVGDVRVDDGAALCLFEPPGGHLEELRVGAGVPRKTADICFNHGHGGLNHSITITWKGVALTTTR